MAEVAAELGVIGGSGLYAFHGLVDRHEIATPYGSPSGPVSIGEAGGRRVAFLPRHGPDHEFPAHRVNYRANLWAMRELGVHAVLGPCASGSLQPHIQPGEFVVCDQLVDRTTGRPQTFFDGPEVHHVGFADPYCQELREVAVRAGREEGITVHDGGSVVVIEGPRFSTRAESRWFAEMGWDVVNMTQHPEAVLARELGLCYTAIALVTDYDAGVPGVDPVTEEAVFGFFEANVDRVKALLVRALAAVPDDLDCHDSAGRPEPGPQPAAATDPARPRDSAS